MSSSQYKRLAPLLNRILIKRFEPVTKTASGILLQEQGDKHFVGEVVEVGPGTHDSHGKFVPVSCKVGDHVLLPDFGGSKVKLEENTYYIYRDTDLLGVLHK